MRNSGDDTDNLLVWKKETEREKTIELNERGKIRYLTTNWKREDRGGRMKTKENL